MTVDQGSVCSQNSNVRTIVAQSVESSVSGPLNRARNHSRVITVPVYLADELMTAIDEYRFATRKPNRAAAIKALLKAGMRGGKRSGKIIHRAGCLRKRR